MARARVNLLPLAHPEDIEGWTHGAVHILVRTLADVAERRIRGPRLIGELKGCRKLFLMEAKVRVVYRMTPKGVEVIAIGLREDSEVYHLACARLGRKMSGTYHAEAA